MPYFAREESLLHLPEEEIEKIITHYFAALTIQQQLLECYYNPKYKMCRNRLQLEFNDMISGLH